MYVDGNFIEVIPRGWIDKMLVLFPVMTYYQTGNNPLPETVMSQFSVIYMHHQASLVYLAKP